MADSKPPPAPSPETSTSPERPNDIPPGMWDTISPELKTGFARVLTATSKLEEIVAGIPSGRAGSVDVSMSLAIADIERFANGEMMLSVPDPAPEMNRALDRQREDAKASLVALRGEFDRLMWRAMYEHTQRQRAADLERAERQREEDRREQEHQRELDRRERETQLEEEKRMRRSGDKKIALRRAQDVSLAERNIEIANQSVKIANRQKVIAYVGLAVTIVISLVSRCK